MTSTAASVADLVDALHGRLLDGWPSIDPSEVTDVVRALVRSEAPLLTGVAEAEVVAAVAARVRGLGPLDPLLSDPSVTEVMLNGGGRVWVERDGRLEGTDVVVDEPTALRIVERIVAPLGLRVDRSSPMVDARLPDGSRVHAVVRPLAIDGPCLTVRRFGTRPVPLDAFGSSAVVDLLRRSVVERRNVVVSGGTGAGKTTLLNALAAAIPDDERILTIEDAAELRLPGEHVVRLEARPANAEGQGAVTIRDLVRTALRMRPDRIVVGECRGPEALDMLQAMNTGHEGSMSTCHANGPDDALRRLETLSLLAGLELPLDAVREQLAAAVDVVVQVARTSTGSRRIVAVGEPTIDGDGALRCRRIVDGDVLFGPLARAPRSVR